MSIPHDEVQRVAALARLAIPEGEVAQVAGQLSAILDFAAQLDQLDLADCEPTAFAPEAAALRADAPDGRQLAPGIATDGAPEAEDGHFLLPTVVEHVTP